MDGGLKEGAEADGVEDDAGELVGDKEGRVELCEGGAGAEEMQNRGKAERSRGDLSSGTMIEEERVLCA